MSPRGCLIAASIILAFAPASATTTQTTRGTTVRPIAVVETVKGSFEIQFFPADAPQSVEHLVALIRKNFYRGLRVHRVTPSLIQFGDPSTRNMTLEASWGSGGSGKSIGVVEISPARHHVRGAVGLAHAGELKTDARFADSQLYIMKTASPSLDGKYAIVGQVTMGMDVVDRLEKRDVLKNIYIKDAGPGR